MMMKRSKDLSDDAQGDEGDAEATREHAHLRHLEVLQGREEGSEQNEWTDP